MEIYRDGRKVGNQDISTLNIGEWYTGRELYIGGPPTEAHFTDGRISDFSIRNYAVRPGNDLSSFVQRSQPVYCTL